MQPSVTASGVGGREPGVDFDGEVVLGECLFPVELLRVVSSHGDVLVPGRSLHEVSQRVDRVVSFVGVLIEPRFFEGYASLRSADGGECIGGVVLSIGRAGGVERFDEHIDGTGRGILLQDLAGGIDERAVIGGECIGGEFSEGGDIDLADGSQH